MVVNIALLELWFHDYVYHSTRFSYANASSATINALHDVQADDQNSVCKNICALYECRRVLDLNLPWFNTHLRNKPTKIAPRDHYNNEHGAWLNRRVHSELGDNMRNVYVRVITRGQLKSLQDPSQLHLLCLHVQSSPHLRNAILDFEPRRPLLQNLEPSREKEIRNQVVNRIHE